MSFADVGSESLRPILLRTPAPNEKVLLYLEGMQREAIGLGSPTSTLIRHDLPSARCSAFSNDNGWRLGVQDGRKAEISINARSAVHELGTQDRPGPRYELFDSGPSFGKKARSQHTHLVL
ncbi:hypothetical protein CY34DRAFT_110405 [Suillus luteus UH-Slu-Lm8-n1]|uniref:Uncharacterized protein n=1 Tax=Suillus luteus UH-Slu-Lm8-n1 TaxID=930992 RepID=A0A0D0AIM8_9AGAM|nr:hypothetical protein CY34DRAFT_110405 [Suillus luteus UH-Slu-Lm8-n1]